MTSFRPLFFAAVLAVTSLFSCGVPLEGEDSTTPPDDLMSQAAPANASTEQGLHISRYVWDNPQPCGRPRGAYTVCHNLYGYDRGVYISSNYCFLNCTPTGCYQAQFSKYQCIIET
ncbi:MAG: hypothetical protein IPJ65_40275 [Archangiaceae bacterium]|nr:hypothetical protein [Archangiaceae bacterium]